MSIDDIITAVCEMECDSMSDDWWVSWENEIEKYRKNLIGREKAFDREFRRSLIEGLDGEPERCEGFYIEALKLLLPGYPIKKLL